ncbi:MAG TPA: major capsid family protein, partial [Stellaceae bacterium]|nr:major capsid family protein [Stellaceae bacterium]
MPLDGLMLRPRSGGAARGTMVTYDSRQPTYDSAGNHLGKHLGQRYMAHDGLWYDSTGAFYQGELVRMDQALHLPLASVSWGRDVDIRSDVTIADEASSWTISTFGSPGGLGMSNAITGGKAWIGKNTTEIAGVSVDIALQTKPLREYAIELKYTVLELESALKIGRPIDQQKYQGMRLKHQMDIDCMVYAGDSDTGDVGLVNQPLSDGVLPGAGIITNLPAGSGSGSPTGWMNGKTPAEILADFNFALNSVWAATAWAVVPRRVLLPTAQYGYIATELVSTAGTTSILRYIEENNLLSRAGQGRLEIYPSKWCNGAGAGGTI